MKVSEIKQLIESIVTDEVRKTIMEESEGNKEVYHIKCEGVPLGTYSSQEEAENDMDKFKEGLMDQLWDTDLTHYLPEDDFYKVGHEEGWADHIILTLKIND